MAKFYVWKKQVGSGCDYTIGCGERVNLVEAKNEKEIVSWMINNPDFEGSNRYGEFGFGTDFELSEVIIFPIESRYVVDVAELKRQCNEVKNAKELKAKEENERKEYERLRKKFEEK
jgi:hypothetical protein